MYLSAVKYLAPGSDAMELYQAKKFAEFDKHLAKLEEAKRKMEGSTMHLFLKCLLKGHNWELVGDFHVFDSYSQYPVRIERTYQCSCCLKIKKVDM